MSKLNKSSEIEKLKHQLQLEKHNHRITKGSLAMAHARMKEAGLIDDDHEP